jgi:hypothetical protein
LELQFRALYIIRNITKVNKQLAIRIVETDLMDVLFAIKEMKDDQLVNEKVIRTFYFEYLLIYFLFRIEK